MKKLIYIVLVLALSALLVNGCDWLSGGILDSDPNRLTSVPLMEQLANLQSVMYGWYEGDLSIWSIQWMQQLAGVAHQYMGYELFEMTSALFGDRFNNVYQEGGLIDQDEVAARAETEGLGIVAGIAKMHEAIMMAMAAFAFGDMPYSEAAQPGTFPYPHYDDQKDIHDAILDLLDEAIADFAAGQDYFDGAYDFSFGGDADKWIAAAHSLKARILLNWAEVNNGNYALALAEAQQGISSLDGSWRSWHSEAAGMQLVMYQFKYQERWYVRVGAHLLNMLQDAGDPRLAVYYSTNADGVYKGSAHGEFIENASWWNEETIGGAAWPYDILSWEETQFIIAECQYQTGSEAAALATLNATLAGLEDKWATWLNGANLPQYSGLSGTALLEAIMNEKYIALVQNGQVWNDWKRTGYPELTTKDGLEIPRRYMYPEDEENTNENFPGVLGIYARNDNDPN